MSKVLSNPAAAKLILGLLLQASVTMDTTTSILYFNRFALVILFISLHHSVVFSGGAPNCLRLHAKLVLWRR